MDDAFIILNQIAFNFNLQALLPMFIAYKSVFFVMWIAYLFHFLPDKYEWLMERFLANITLLGRVVVLIFFVWLVIQAKQADQVMPIYLQF